MPTKIEWTSETWNPIVGCSPISEGCQNCYARRFANRFYQNYPDVLKWNGKLLINVNRFEKPLHWKKPRMVFVCSMSDLFHENNDELWINKIFDIIKQCPQHTFQILTKRAIIMAKYFESHRCPANVWVGATIENSEKAEERIQYLFQIAARIRFISVEPMLGPVRLKNFVYIPNNRTYKNQLHWVICGGETGPKVRSLWYSWAHDLKDDCLAAGIPFFFKQWNKKGENWLDGQRWHQYP